MTRVYIALHKDDSADNPNILGATFKSRIYTSMEKAKAVLRDNSRIWSGNGWSKDKKIVEYELMPTGVVEDKPCE